MIVCISNERATANYAPRVRRWNLEVPACRRRRYVEVPL
jgi:hypothetical protein